LNLNFTEKNLPSVVVSNRGMGVANTTLASRSDDVMLTADDAVSFFEDLLEAVFSDLSFVKRFAVISELTIRKLAVTLGHGSQGEEDN
jgi:hypothetical protein